MSVGSIASAAAAGSTVITLTVGTGGGAYGYSDGSVAAVFGASAPAIVYGKNIAACYCVTGNTLIFLTGVVSANFFNNVTFKYGASGATARNLTTASATFANPGGTSSQWTWNAQGTLTVTDNTLARFVIFNR